MRPLSLISRYAPRVLLAAVGLILVWAGIRLGLQPGETGLEATSPAGLSNIRVAFGGFHTGLGLFAIGCAVRTSTLRIGLVAVGTTAACVIAFRLLGIGIDGADPENIGLLKRESVSLVLLALAFALLRFGPTGAART